jgi:hypothetical protein
MIVTEGWNANDALDASDKKAMALKDRFGWLQEWESAQRQQRQQVGGQSTGSDEAQSRAMRESPTQSASRPRPENPLAQSADAHRPAATVSEQATVSKAASSRVAVAGTRPEAAEGRILGPAGAFHQALDRVGLLPPTSGQCFSWFTRAPSAWQPYVYQVVRTAGGVRVWIRDARIDASSGSSILGALRSQFACIGMTLASVTINGKTVWEAPAEGRCPEGGSGDLGGVLLVNQLY